MTTAQDQYTSNLLAKGTAMLAQTKAQGSVPFAGSSYDNPSATSPNGAITYSNPVGTGGATNTGGGTPPATPFSGYSDYLKKYSESLNQSQDVTDAATKSADIAGRYDTTDLAARHAYEAALDTPGMLKSGAEATAAMGRRRSNAELADIAVQGSAADRRLQALTGVQTAERDYLKTQAELAKPMQIGDKFFDPLTGTEIPGMKTPAPFDLSPGQSRFTYNPTTGQYEKTASLPSTPQTLSYTQQKSQAQTTAQQQIAALFGQATPGTRDAEGFVIPSVYRDHRAAWVADGFSGAEFDSIFGGYVNPTKAKEYGTTFQTKPSSNSGIDPELQALLDSLNN